MCLQSQTNKSLVRHSKSVYCLASNGGWLMVHWFFSPSLGFVVVGSQCFSPISLIMLCSKFTVDRVKIKKEGVTLPFIRLCKLTKNPSSISFGGLTHTYLWCKLKVRYSTQISQTVAKSEPIFSVFWQGQLSQLQRNLSVCCPKMGWPLKRKKKQKPLT